jgi:hypothetical protein
MCCAEQFIYRLPNAFRQPPTMPILSIVQVLIWHGRFVNIEKQETMRRLGKKALTSLAVSLKPLPTGGTVWWGKRANTSHRRSLMAARFSCKKWQNITIRKKRALINIALSIFFGTTSALADSWTKAKLVTALDGEYPPRFGTMLLWNEILTGLFSRDLSHFESMSFGLDGTGNVSPRPVRHFPTLVGGCAWANRA